MKAFAGIMVFALLGLASAIAQDGSSPVAAAAAAKRAAKPTTAASQSKIDSGKEADIRRLLELVGAKSLTEEMLNSTLTNLRPALASALPPGDYREKLIDLFYAKFKAKADIQQIVNMSVAAYDKHFSHEEIKGLIKFYETPLGQKAISVLPQLMTEMGAEGKTWGERLGRESMQEVLAEHPEMQAALEAAGKAAQQR